MHNMKPRTLIPTVSREGTDWELIWFAFGVLSKLRHLFTHITPKKKILLTFHARMYVLHSVFYNFTYTKSVLGLAYYE